MLFSRLKIKDHNNMKLDRYFLSFYSWQSRLNASNRTEQIFSGRLLKRRFSILVLFPSDLDNITLIDSRLISLDLEYDKNRQYLLLFLDHIWQRNCRRIQKRIQFRIYFIINKLCSLSGSLKERYCKNIIDTYFNYPIENNTSFQLKFSQIGVRSISIAP